MSKQFHFNQFSSIWPIDRTLSSATNPRQSEPGSGGNEGVLSSITGTSPSDCLVSYPRHSLRDRERWGGVLPLCRDAVSVFYSLSRLGKILLWSYEINSKLLYNLICYTFIFYFVKHFWNNITKYIALLISNI